MSTIITVTNISSTDVDQEGINPVEIYLAPTLGVDTSGITDAVAEAKEYADRAEAAALDAESSQTDAELAQQAAEAAEAQTTADAIQTSTDAAQTAADRVATAADAVQTNADVQTTNTNVALTNADVVDSAANAAEALSHANDANDSRIAAQQSAANAEAAFDNFDDKYLGRKTEAPTVDNDGDPLQVGATYWHDYQDGTGTLFYWNGAEWEAPDKAASASAQAAEASATAALASEGASQAAQIAAEAAQTGAEAAEDNAELHALDAEAAANEAREAGAGSAAFETAREQRKREYAGSGFSEWGTTYTRSGYPTELINDGMFSQIGSYPNGLLFGRISTSTSYISGDSRTNTPIAIVDGVEYLISQEKSNSYQAGTVIDFPTAPDGAKTLNASTGEVHKYHDLAGVGESYEAHTVDFDGSTYIDLSDSPYVMPAGSSFDVKVKLSGNTTVDQYIFDTNEPNRNMYLYQDTNGGELLRWGGIRNVFVNGVATPGDSLVLDPNVEYHITGEFIVSTVVYYIGARYTQNNAWDGEIWDITLASNEDGVEPVHYNTAKFQPKADAAPVVTTVDGGDNPDMDAGYYVDYQADGSVLLPAFPVADSMTVSMKLSINEQNRRMLMGTNTGGSAFMYFDHDVENNRFDISIGNVSNALTFPLLQEGKIYDVSVTLTKDEGAATYTATGNVNGAENTRDSIVFNDKSFEDFRIGRLGNDSTYAGQTWGGVIKDFTITYPDSPDLNRSYPSFESSDPSGRLTVTDELGFTTQDWAPNFIPNDHISIPVWNVDSTSYDLTYECTVVPTAIHSWRLGQTFTLDDEVNRFYFRFDNSGTMTWGAGNATFQVPFTYNIGDTINLKMVITPDLNVDCYINGSVVVSGTTAFRADFQLDNFYIGAAGTSGGSYSEGITGSVFNVRLTDNTNPANSRHYPLVVNSATQPDTLVAVDEGYDKDTAPFYTPDWDGYNNYVSIPELTQDAGDIVEFNLVCPHADEGWCVMLSGGTDDLAINSTGNWIFSGGTLTVDGVAVTSGAPADLNTETKRVVYTRTTTRTLLKFGASTSGGNTLGTNWRMWDITITDVSDTTNSRYYPSLIYSPDAIPTGTVLEETLKPNKCTNGGFSSDVNGWDAVSGSVEWVASYQGNNGVLRLNDSGSWTHAYETDVALEVGKRYTISVVVRHDSGGTINYNFYNTRAVDGSDIQETVSVPSGAWTAIEAEFVAISADWGIGADGTIPVHFSNVVVTAHDDGTLVNFPANNEWTLAQVDGATDGMLENFTVGSEWDNDLPITDGTMVGFVQPWKYNTGRYTASIVGNTTFTPMTLQDAQKAFLEAKNTDSEVIISRKDLAFLETWKEEVVGFVCPFGNVQFGGTSHDGSSLVDVTDFIAQGYSAFGEWDGSTVGHVANWDLMNNADKVAWMNNPKNNIVYDSSVKKYFQYRYRIRVVEGLGDEWLGTLAAHSNYLRNTGTIYGCVKPQGSDDSTDDFSNGSYFETYRPNADSNHLTDDVGYFQSIRANQETAKAVPIALVQRLNQGAYHPTYNPQGTGRTTNVADNAWKQWYYTDKVAFNTEQMFTERPLGWKGKGNETGAIASPVGTGRSDQYDFYDAIYAGQVEDLRLNANKQNKQELLTDAVRRGVRGETRGKGKVPWLIVSDINNMYVSNSTTFNLNLTSTIENGSVGTGTGTQVGDFVHLIRKSDGQSLSATCTSVNSFGNATFVLDSGSLGDIGLPTGGSTWSPEFGHTMVMQDFVRLSAEYDSLPWVDIIGDPERIAATFPDGVVGQWIAGDYSSTVNGTRDLNAKSTHSAPNWKYTYNDGSSWSGTTHSVDTVTNTITLSGHGSNPLVGLLTYEALSDFTESDDNRAVVGELGDVWSGMSYNVDEGNRLSPSLVEVIGKNGNNNRQSYTTLTSYELNSGGSLAPSSYSNETRHEPLVIANPANGSDAVKALPHLVEKDGLYYVQWHGTQLVYDGNSFLPWGDDSEVTIVDDESTKNDLNDNEVKVVTHTELIPVGIANKNETL